MAAQDGGRQPLRAFLAKVIASGHGRMRLRALPLVALALMPLSARAQEVKPLDHEVTLRYAGTGISFSTAPILVGIAKGFFEEKKLKLLNVAAGQSAAVCQQLLAKAVELGECAMNDTIQVVQMSGAPLVLVSNQTVSALNYGIMAKPNIKTWADLKGKTIIVGGPKDNTVYFTRVMTRPNGLKDTDYQFQFAGASSARFAALKSGAVDAAILTDPFDSEAELQGFVRLGDLRPKYLGADTYSGGGIIATRDWAKEHPDVVVALIRAMWAAKQWIYDPANKEEFFEILKPKINVTREAFERTYQRNIVEDKMWTTDAGPIGEKSIQGIVDALVELGSLPPPAPAASKFFDNTYANIAMKLGR